MKEDWVLIYSTKGDSRAKLMKRVLRQNGIESHILHRVNAVYPMFGEAKLYAPSEKAAKALKVLRTSDLRAIAISDY